MKKYVKYLIIFMVVVYLAANRQIVISLYDRVMLLIDSMRGAEYVGAEETSKRIEHAIRGKDAEELKGLFSEYTLRLDHNIDEEIDALFAMDDWSITYRKGKLQKIIEINDPYIAEKMIVGKYTVTTYTGKFVILFIEQTMCSSIKSKIGLTFLQCARAENKDVKFYDDTSKTGVLVIDK